MSVNPLLGPVIALVAWTLVMLFWMAAQRLPKMRGLKAPPGARGSDLPPGPHNWAGHNYTNLAEQPTIFYAIVLALVALGDTHALNLTLAWAYVIIRVVHSVWQATVNTLPLRFSLFVLSTLCLIALTLHAAIRFLNG